MFYLTYLFLCEATAIHDQSSYALLFSSLIFRYPVATEQPMGSHKFSQTLAILWRYNRLNNLFA